MASSTATRIVVDRVSKRYAGAVRRCVTIRGVHNYAPRHLLAALDFVRDQRDRLPLGELVDARFPLAETDAALTAAAERRALRPAVVP
jgi:hypothetical protein